MSKSRDRIFEIIEILTAEKPWIIAGLVLDTIMRVRNPVQTLDWLESHIGSIDEAIELIRQFSWHLKVINQDNIWYVLDGEAKIFSSPIRENVDAFLYGLALAYSVIPEPLYNQLKKDLANWITNL